MEEELEGEVGMIVMAVLIGLVFLYLIYYTTFYTYSFVENYNEIFEISRDNLLFHILTLLGILLFLFLMEKGMKKWKTKERIISNVILVISMVIVTFLGLEWIKVVNVQPVADQTSVYNAAVQFAAKDYSQIMAGGYLSRIPYQIGLTDFFTFLFRITGRSDYRLIQEFNVWCLPVLIWAGTEVMRFLGKNDRCGVIYDIAMILCFPIIFYTPFVYGETVSLTLGMLYIYFMILYWEKRWVWVWILQIPVAILGIRTRGNFWVLVVAGVFFVLVKAVEDLRKKQYGMFLLSAVLPAVILVLSPIIADKALILHYERVAQCSIGKGMPTISNIAMGMHDEGTQPSGWHNRYNYDNYMAANEDSEKAAEQAKEYIGMRLRAFLNGSADWKAYYKEKVLTQWTEPTYQCLLANHSFLEEPGEFVQSLYYGDWRNWFSAYMNEYQWLMYLGVLIGLFYVIRRRKEWIYFSIPLVLFGGFLFSILWEAKTRYIYPYFIYMIPFSLWGFLTMSEDIGSGVREWKKRRD